MAYLTYGQVLTMGYRDADSRYQRGYISRRVDADSQPVHVAGGNRRGALYVLLPAANSSQYCIRQYLRLA